MAILLVDTDEALNIDPAVLTVTPANISHAVLAAAGRDGGDRVLSSATFDGNAMTPGPEAVGVGIHWLEGLSYLAAAIAAEEKTATIDYDGQVSASLGVYRSDSGSEIAIVDSGQVGQASGAASVGATIPSTETGDVIVFFVSINNESIGNLNSSGTQCGTETGQGHIMAQYRQAADAGSTDISVARPAGTYDASSLVWFHLREIDTATITDVDTDDTIDEAQQNVAINGSGFGAVQGTGGVTIDGVAQTVDTWSDTQITIDHAADLNKYGSQTLEVTTDDDATAQRTVTIDPPAGTSFVDITNVDNSDIDSVPALAPGDQLRYDSVSTPSGYPITVDQNGQISVDAVDPDGDTFTVAVWDPGTTDWGADATQTIETDDTTAPTIQSLTINTAGDQITMALDESVVAGADGFDDLTLSLSGGAVTAAFSSGSGSANLVYDLGRTVLQGETGTGDYTQPGDGIQDSAGNLLATDTGVGVTNNSTQTGDVTAPTIQSATINTAGTQLTLALDENVVAGVDGFDDLTLSLSGGAVTAAYTSGSGSSSLVYNLSRTVEAGETGTADYTQPGDGIQDAAGNLLATDTGVAVTNNSTADVTAPQIQSVTINVAGDTATVAFDEAVVAGVDGFDDLTLNLSGGAITATFDSGSGSTSLVFTLSRVVGQGETGTADYTQPGDGIQDAAGNLVATVTGVAVTNNAVSGEGHIFSTAGLRLGFGF